MAVTMAFAPRLGASLVPHGLSLLIVVAVGAATIRTALLDADLIPLSILLAAVALPVAIFAGAQALQWKPSYVLALTLLVMVFACATFRLREIEDKSIDTQIVLRLLSLAAMGVMACAGILRTRARGASDVPAIWFAFLLYTVVTSIYSAQALISLVETISNLAAFAFLYVYHRVLGSRRLVMTLIAACCVLCCLSIVAYIIHPTLGRMSDWVNGAFIPTSRLTGVFGAANGAGAAAGLGLMLTVLLSGFTWRHPSFYVLTLPMVFCLVLSHNRMSIATVALCFSYVWVMRGEAALKLALLILAVGAGALLMASYGDQILASVSRSGSTEEITSGTGRTRIWAVVLDLWMQQPLFGYGEGSAKFILPVHPLLFKAAAHAHNLYLSVLFAGGAVGLVLFVAAVLVTVRRALHQKAQHLVAVLMFPLIYGITESTINGFVSFVPICFFGVVVLIFGGPADAVPVRGADRSAGGHRPCLPRQATER
jgi:O-antigen ligase